MKSALHSLSYIAVLAQIVSAENLSAAPKDGICFGGTTPGMTNWNQYSDKGVFVKVDESACKFKKNPVVVASESGESHHWTTTGGSAIYSDTATGYANYIKQPAGITKLQAQQNFRWASNFISHMPGKSKSGTCAGATPPGSTKWVKYLSDGMYVDVDTSMCGFSKTPVYKTSCGGIGHHWVSKGCSSLYSVTKKGFRVYINSAGTTTAKAKEWKWHIKWVAHPAGTEGVVPGVGKTCAGKTVTKKTAWKVCKKECIKGSIYVDVKTGCKFWGATPRYVTAVAGSESHWTLTGTSEIYHASATGFRMYLNAKVMGGVTPAKANELGWTVHWMAAAPEPRLCWGSTPKKSRWSRYSAKGITLEVDTTACHEMDRPVYVSSLGGDATHWVTTGSSAIYGDLEMSETWKSFHTYIYYNGITVNYAKKVNWHMNFLALPAGKSKLGICAGETPQGTTNWKQYQENGLYVDVDTSMCDFSQTPVYKTSIGGIGGHWETKGSSALYNMGKKGFRVYIFQKGVTVERATNSRWHIKWIAHPKGELVHTGGMSCAGMSSSSDWKVYKPDRGKGIYIHVKTGCKFGGRTPTYVTAIAGTSGHWTTTGASEPYHESADSFTIYLHQASGGLTPAFAKKNSFSIQWIAAGTPPPTPAPTPAPPPKKYVKKGGGWAVSKGKCKIDASIAGRPCVVSPNFPGKHMKEEKCIVNLGHGTTHVGFERFETEKWFDYVQIGKAQYSGRIKSGTAVKLASPPTITWSSDFFEESKGWKICKKKAPKLLVAPRKKKNDKKGGKKGGKRGGKKR